LIEKVLSSWFNSEKSNRLGLTMSITVSSKRTPLAEKEEYGPLENGEDKDGNNGSSFKKTLAEFVAEVVHPPEAKSLWLSVIKDR
jgi:hypothetical protein